MNNIKSSLIIILMLLLTFTINAQTQKTFKWPDHKAFTEKYYKGNASKEASYWLGVFVDYGAIKPFKVAERWVSKNRLAIWFQGKDTKGWATIILSMNKKNTKIVGTAISKGRRPSGILPPYKALSPQEITLQLKPYLENLSNLDYFSGTVLVAKGDEIIFEGAYGLRNKQLSKKNTINTSFVIASVSKTFTAVAILQLIEKGKIKISDPISKYINEYPKDIANQVTIEHLLNHTSGIELDNYGPYNRAKKKAKNLDELLTAHLKYINHMNEGRRKNFKALGKYDYSNENFSLLGTIIERVSGVTYAKYIEKNILEPTGIQHSFSDYNLLEEHTDKAIGYSNKNNSDVFLTGPRKENTMYKFAVPEGGIYSNVKDLYTYFKAINSTSIINETSKRWIYERKVPASTFSDNFSSYYTYGFEIKNQGKASTIGHTGKNFGVGSSFQYYPKQDYYVIILSNYGFVPSQTVSGYIKDLIEPND